MGAKVNFDADRVARSFEASYGRAQEWLDHQVVADTEPFVPFDSSDLATSALNSTDFGSGEITYEQPYAAAQYYGLPNKRKSAHPQATMRWFEVSKAANKSRWIQMAKRLAGKR